MFCIFCRNSGNYSKYSTPILVDVVALSLDCTTVSTESSEASDVGKAKFSFVQIRAHLSQGKYLSLSDHGLQSHVQSFRHQ